MYVGVIPLLPFGLASMFGIPHVRGGDPSNRSNISKVYGVFPMYVGVILVLTLLVKSWRSIPHVRGGDPLVAQGVRNELQYSPCTWG